MLTKRIIPCLDVKDGRVVKGINFENLIDAGDPVAQAKFYYEQGADELCFLDISASQENRSTMIDMVKKVAQVCFIPFTVGGGIRELQDFANLLQCGADKISINSAAIKNPNLITEASNKFGAQAVVVAIDAKKNVAGNYEIFSHGGSRETGIDAIAWAKEAQRLGAGEILLTSIDRDGSKRGYDLELLQKITTQLSIPVIASGGVGNLDHLYDGLNSGASAVLAASIFHFKTFTIAQAKEFLHSKNIPIRLQ
jgi:cyclase